LISVLITIILITMIAGVVLNSSDTWTTIALTSFDLSGSSTGATQLNVRSLLLYVRALLTLSLSD
jgi:hypothetical protein